ncbi:MAG: hypothetical protein JWP59_482 [Massilia sp.]|nr:hypothetical protein [Massilia sp.]
MNGSSRGASSAPSSPRLFATAAAAGIAAMREWRLLLLWVLLSLLPTLVMALPVFRLLGALDYSVQAPALAGELDMVALADLVQHYNRSGAALPLAALLALALTLILSPFLTGMAVSAARAETRLSVGALAAGGLQEYPRMARMLVVALLPLIAAALLGGAARGMADRYAETALLASKAASASLAASIVMAVLLVLAHASIDAARAHLALDRRRRSAFKAWWHGCKQVARRPLATLVAYLPLTLIALVVAAALSLARVHLPHVDGAGLVAAFVLTQLIVLVLAWMRTARLFAMIGLARKLAAS